jgi:hypothetical protein
MPARPVHEPSLVVGRHTGIRPMRRCSLRYVETRGEASDSHMFTPLRFWPSLNDRLIARTR